MSGASFPPGAGHRQGGSAQGWVGGGEGEGRGGNVFLIKGEAEAVPGQEEVGPMCGGDPSHEQVVRHHDQEEISQVA